MSVVLSFVLITKLSLLLTGIPIRLLAHLSVSSISLSLSLSLSLKRVFFRTWVFSCPFAFFLSFVFLFFLFCLVNLLRLSPAVANFGVEDRAICPRVLGSKNDFRFFRDIRFSSNPRPVLSLSLSPFSRLSSFELNLSTRCRMRRVPVWWEVCNLLFFSSNLLIPSQKRDAKEEEKQKKRVLWFSTWWGKHMSWWVLWGKQMGLLLCKQRAVCKTQIQKGYYELIAWFLCEKVDLGQRMWICIW